MALAEVVNGVAEVADGTLTSFHFRNVSNTGAYGNHGGETLFAGDRAWCTRTTASSSHTRPPAYTRVRSPP